MKEYPITKSLIENALNDISALNELTVSVRVATADYIDRLCVKADAAGVDPCECTMLVERHIGIDAVFGKRTLADRKYRGTTITEKLDILRRALECGNPPGALLNYIRNRCRRTVAEKRRRAPIRRRRDLRDDFDPDHRPPPDENVEWVRTNVQKLPRNLRRALEFRMDAPDLTQRQRATAMGVTRDEFQTLSAQARNELRDLLVPDMA